MFTSLEIENYRCLKRYRLAHLGRVNLLVGRSNCGKSSLLEAIELLASGGDPQVFFQAARARGEVISGEGPGALLDVSHFFHGHEFRPGAYFALRRDGAADGLTVRVKELGDLDEGTRCIDPGTGFHSPLALCFEGALHPEAGAVKAVAVSRAGAFPTGTHFYPRPPTREGLRGIVQFIRPESADQQSMSRMWDAVIVEGREDEVAAAMRVVEPRVSRVFFLSGDVGGQGPGGSRALVGLEGVKRRLPLGTCGGGMHRLLALALGLIRAADGVLLVDEIDTGLHHSVMGDMWRLVIESARNSNVQVFASTHSLDCVRALAWLCGADATAGSQVSLQKIEPELEEAVALDADKIVTAVDQGIEVR
ncbi:MAG: AAA family ATPase [Candidatus Brocadiae bacterium]|nr:AAA family ATPase [Candidatus Brocadiia bacterium]